MALSPLSDAMAIIIPFPVKRPSGPAQGNPLAWRPPHPHLPHPLPPRTSIAPPASGAEGAFVDCILAKVGAARPGKYYDRRDVRARILAIVEGNLEDARETAKD